MACSSSAVPSHERCAATGRLCVATSGGGQFLTVSQNPHVWDVVANKKKHHPTPTTHHPPPTTHHQGLRQQLGWKKVLGTADSGIWMLKGESRCYTLPSNLDHLGVAWMEKWTYSTAWARAPVCLCLKVRSWCSSRATVR